MQLYEHRLCSVFWPVWAGRFACVFDCHNVMMNCFGFPALGSHLWAARGRTGWTHSVTCMLTHLEY
jgi:hypothetical protein